MEKGEDMNTIRWKMPDQYLTEWYRNLSGAVKTAFYAAFAAGLAAHLYQFTNYTIMMSLRIHQEVSD